MTITTTGYGDIHADTTLERVFSTVSMVIGSGIYVRRDPPEVLNLRHFPFLSPYLVGLNEGLSHTPLALPRCRATPPPSIRVSSLRLNYWSGLFLGLGSH